MIDPRHIDYADRAARAARSGSPLAVDALGRLIGLGQAEREALFSGRVPTVLWVTLILGVGFVAGARVQKRWPGRLPPIVSGG